MEAVRPGPLVGDEKVGVAINTATLSSAPPQTYGSETWGGNKLLLAVNASMDGPVLVLGVSTNGHELGFGEAHNPNRSRLLDLETGRTLQAGWIDFLNTIRINQTNCYSIQFDYPSGTSVVTLFLDMNWRLDTEEDTRPMS